MVPPSRLYPPPKAHQRALAKGRSGSAIAGGLISVSVTSREAPTRPPLWTFAHHSQVLQSTSERADHAWCCNQTMMPMTKKELDAGIDSEHEMDEDWIQVLDCELRGAVSTNSSGTTAI